MPRFPANVGSWRQTCFLWVTQWKLNQCRVFDAYYPELTWHKLIIVVTRVIQHGGYDDGDILTVWIVGRKTTMNWFPTIAFTWYPKNLATQNLSYKTFNYRMPVCTFVSLRMRKAKWNVPQHCALMVSKREAYFSHFSDTDCYFCASIYFSIKTTFM